MNDVQLIAILAIVIPPLVGLLKKLKIPPAVVPFIPLILGVVGEVVLVAAGMSSLDYAAAVLVGLGVGGAASSGYDINKKVSEAWKKKALIFMLSIGIGCMCCQHAHADILPFIDRLDLQFGPGMVVHDLKPVETEMVMLGTAKIYERSKFQARIGGLVDTKYRALVFGVGRTINDLIIRDDAGENKPLLPAIGVWVAANLIDNNEGEQEVEFLFGINAVMLEY